MKWKDDAPYVLCLSHDVDRIKKQWYHYLVYGIKDPVVQFRSFLEKIKGKEPYWNFLNLIELEESYGVKSTFFFLNESHKEFSANFWGRYNINSKKVQRIIKVLDGKGFEIGLHGSFYSYNNEKLLLEEKEILESIVGHKIVSNRQHHLNFDDERTLEIYKNVGIKYDSSKGYSTKPGKEQPYMTQEGIVELPITLMDTVDLTEDVYIECCRVAEEGGVVVLNFHQCHFNSIEYPRNVEMYERLLEKAENDGAWIANIGELGEWIGARL